MSKWDRQDMYGFLTLIKHNIGQITRKCMMGLYLYNAAKNVEISSYLEIGTWNGCGSTRCIIDGLLQRPINTKPFVFYSLECNTEKCDIAKELYKSVSNIHILNEVLTHNIPDNLAELFPELQDEQKKYYHEIDMVNMKGKPLFLERKDLPVMFDLVLLDGGEFTTWFEYQMIKDRCKILALDDTNTPKCRQIVEELRAQPGKWQIVLDDNSERNGNVVARRIDL